ncbi:sigma-70 family RNA polymerase sigma factor [Bremerella sp. P1]|uniref:sigma-70 family RNA polymerase sigma factor n=1 Tax=Bremerella sp. P1 TaxID=3026424 RepID=UPI0023675D23|nr:sigma-70 family RNA polymerase sigma factor [Bremerella sp. P1]WDI42099.1 sigma-70 family RNA polymerase sigma factor [Bremerella sp. P1]
MIAARAGKAKPMSSEATLILSAMSAGDRSGTDRLIELVYGDFRQLANKYLGHETRSNTLQPTAVVHEVFLKLVDQDKVDWRGRSHFFAVGATAMRHLLVDHARRKGAQKRGGERQRIALDEDLIVSPESDEDVLALDEALKKLAAIDSQRARIVELRFFGGLTNDEVAEVLDVSKRTIQKQWAGTRVWLRSELSEPTEE